MSATTEAKIFSATKLGPIPRLTVTMDSYGITVLIAPNGAGKSIFLDTMQKVAAGKGRLPLSDGAKKGVVEACGARVTIGASTRHTGEFQVTNLEGRFDLSQLVDPQLKSPEAADRRRVAALVSISGIKGDEELFRSHEAFADFDEVCGAANVQSSDLVEMAASIKARYETRARAFEEDAKTAETRAAVALSACDGLDMDVECSSEVLQVSYDQARDAMVEAETTRTTADRLDEAARNAHGELADAKLQYGGPTVKVAGDAYEAKLEELQDIFVQIEKLKTRASIVNEEVNTSRVTHEAAQDHERIVSKCKEIITADTLESPTDEQIEHLKASVETTSAAQETGVKVREAKKKRSEAAELQAACDKYSQQAASLRESAHATEDVLSAAIQSERFRVVAVNGVTRVVVNHKRGPDTPYHELSEGERWTHAIDEGADRVGEDGLLVIPQGAWESIDIFVRPEIHAHAIERKVYILTAEATRNADDGHGMLTRPFGE